MSEAQPIPAGPGPPLRGSRAPRLEARTSRRRLLADRAARWLVIGGGMAIIASILGILFFIAIEVYPLLGRARVTAGPVRPLVGADAVAIVTDEYRSHLATLSRDGFLRVIRTDNGELVHETSVAGQSARLTGVRGEPGKPLLSAATADGKVIAVPVKWDVSFVGQRRVVSPELSDPVVFELGATPPLGPFATSLDPEGRGAAAAVTDDGSLVVVFREMSENFLTGETTEQWDRFESEAPADLTALVMDYDCTKLYGGTRSGELMTWGLAGGQLGRRATVRGSGSPVTTLSLLLGDRSLVVGREDGSLAVWFEVRQRDESFRLTMIRELGSHPGPIRLIAPSMRNKGFLAQDESGRLGLYYSTSNRVLWTGSSPLPGATSLFYAPKADGAFLGGPGQMAALEIDNPHPEFSFSALFGRIWYEGYPGPAHVWQSTGGTDEFEPKLSLTPLMVGTLKGTFYSLILAIPLGVLGAMYTSQFMHPSYKRVVKPTVEIMAALPSVVLGFLAGLWLAPRLERVFPALVLMIATLPLLILAAWGLVRLLPRRIRNRLSNGSEVLLYMLVLALGIWLCLEIRPWFEALAFGGSFQSWLLERTGLGYDQRNAVVVGLAMGFAVIPIIFAISEDAFSNVPRNLVSGSLALGANRWQTVTRVVLPTASPGIFSAIMIGFGRAVGETMIVLMATGNTPIMDWNPFNGFRTLSANIAVEIPEAPHGDTLYRTLFLAALILFLFTFAINTVAELIRQRLRKRYAEI